MRLGESFRVRSELSGHAARSRPGWADAHTCLVRQSSSHLNLVVWFCVCVVQEGDMQKCKLSRQEAVGGRNEEKGSFRGQGQTLSMFF